MLSIYVTFDMKYFININRRQSLYIRDNNIINSKSLFVG